MQSRVEVNWAPDELKRINDLFFSVSIDQLLGEINAFRSTPIQRGALRHQVRRMGLYKGIQIRWSKEDIEYLNLNYKERGNKEIAVELNKLKRTFREVNGKKIYREFTKDHVEKKMELLGLRRTPEEVLKIKQRNFKLGLSTCFTPADNLWSRGVKKVAKKEEVRIWVIDGRPIRVIKIKGQFVHYARWFYNNYVQPIPPKHRIRHIDFDTLNDDPSNLVCELKRKLSRNDYEIALSINKDKEKEILKKLSKTKTREQEKPIMADLLRVRGIIKYLTNKLAANEQDRTSDQDQELFSSFEEST